MNSKQRRKFEKAVRRQVEKQGTRAAPAGSSITPTNVGESNTLSPVTRIWKIVAGVNAFSWSVIGAVASIVTIVAVFLVFRSDVTIIPRIRLDPADPFSTLFTVTNEGTFSIEDATFSCHMNYVEIHNYNFAVHDLDGLTDPKGEPEIEARKSQDVACLFGAAGIPIRTSPQGPPPEYHVADITLVVSYRPLLWWRRTQAERFIGRTDGHGKIVEWSHQAG